MSTEVRPRILVVDDEEDIRRVVKGFLRQGYDVLEAPDGEAALALLEKEHESIDLAILDVMMPGRTGLQVCAEVKKRWRIPVVMLTALTDQESRGVGLEAGADDYLGKPIHRRELELRVGLFVRLSRQDRLIRRQLEELEKVSALKDDLAALLVHDLRSPLTGVMGVFDLLLESKELPAADRTFIEVGQQAARRVLGSVGDLLQVRMMEEGQLPLDRRPVRLDELLAELMRVVEPRGTTKKVKLSLSCPSGLTATVDARLFPRAVENLVVNALRHAHHLVEVQVAREGPLLVVTVADDGDGVPEPLKADLFAKFGSVALQKAGKRRGHGLGLYMVQLTAAAHGGTVTVGDRPGGGAVFRLALAVGEA